MKPGDIVYEFYKGAWEPYRLEAVAGETASIRDRYGNVFDFPLDQLRGYREEAAEFDRRATQLREISDKAHIDFGALFGWV